ncbi:tyrosine-type recombinase/integrase [Sporolactobacillus putidus]|uniref:Site-specific recombinase XerD n=1 Tax=Sporolactobacillus putidus TaxID=492735 RepID=A0A917W349_9BACL|nr:tyrosine-type recombinase/integrase [Sporolactobacillus putidus]GGL58016.1 hypothetical protein GCM10007968_22500 [Sporolactobacillus putidus]
MKCAAREIGKSKYELTVSLGNDGAGHYPRKYKVVSGIKNKGQLEEAKASFIYEVTNGLIDDREKMLFSDLVRDWWKKHASHLSPRTQEGYDSNLRLRVLPAFGQLRIGKIKKYHIMDFFDKLQQPNCEFNSILPKPEFVHQSGSYFTSASDFVIKAQKYNLSVKTMDNHKILLNSIFSYAVEREYIRESPMKGVKTPLAVRKRPAIYDKNDLSKLFSALDSEPLRWQTLVLFALATGAREGEIAGLEWQHINLQAGTVLIEQAAVRIVGKGIAIKSTKSGHERLVNLPAFVMDCLNKFKDERDQEKDDSGETWVHEWNGKPCDFVFSPENGFGKPMRPESISQWWRRFLSRKGLKHIKFHALRHTSVSLLIDEKVPMKDISERAGHSSGIGITMDTYGHLLEDSDKRAAQSLDEAIKQIQKMN